MAEGGMAPGAWHLTWIDHEDEHRRWGEKPVYVFSPGGWPGLAWCASCQRGVWIHSGPDGR